MELFIIKNFGKSLSQNSPSHYLINASRNWNTEITGKPTEHSKQICIWHNLSTDFFKRICLGNARRCNIRNNILITI